MNRSCNDLKCNKELHLENSAAAQKNIHYFEKTDTEKQREFINAQSKCVLCGTILELTHAVDRIIGNIREEAHCPSCEVRTRARFHPLN